MKTVVIFQGGGSLGAYGCGAWAELAGWLQRRGDRIVALAGSSIGALNAAMIASRLHEPDAGVSALLRLWREDIVTPSFPFFGLATGRSGHAEALRSWNGLLTGLLIGNRRLYAPQYANWTPWNALRRLERPLYERSRMWRLLEELAGACRSRRDGEPLIAVTATNLLDGSLRLFHSDRDEIGAAQLAASTAIPLMFDPVDIDGDLYWDGDMVRHSLLPLLLHRLRQSGRLNEGEAAQWVTIEQLPDRSADRLASGPKLLYRLANLLQLGKLAPSEIGDGSKGQRWIRLARSPLPHDAISGQFDYSPERVGRLIEQGVSTARTQLSGQRPGG
jgi:NTE family protein